MEYMLVFTLLVIGLFLILMELFIIPGLPVTGFFGFSFSGLGIYFAYKYFEIFTASMILGIFLIISLIAIYWAFKAPFRNKLLLTDSIKSRVNEESNDLRVGDTGKTISSLRPYGSAEIKNKIYEVKTLGNFCDADVLIKVASIINNIIIVEQTT